MIRWVSLAAVVTVVGAMAGSATSAFPGRNGRLAFVRFLHRNGDVYSILPSGRGLKRLTSGSKDDTDPAWSPNGRQIAFVRNDPGPGPDYESDVFLMNANGSGLHRVTKTPGAEIGLAWSPDGRHFAFSDDADRIVVMRADGTGAHAILAQGESARPAWSPNGHRIAFNFAACDNCPEYLEVMRPDGSDRRRLLRNAAFPNWSPNGRKLAFVRNFDIWTMSADATHRRRITHNPRLDNQPSWSPDGRRIAFISDRSGRGEIWVMNADGANPRQVTHHAQLPSLDVRPDWQPLTR